MFTCEENSQNVPTAGDPEHALAREPDPAHLHTCLAGPGSNLVRRTLS